MKNEKEKGGSKYDRAVMALRIVVQASCLSASRYRNGSDEHIEHVRNGNIAGLALIDIDESSENNNKNYPVSG